MPIFSLRPTGSKVKLAAGQPFIRWDGDPKILTLLTQTAFYLLQYSCAFLAELRNLDVTEPARRVRGAGL